MPTLRLSTRIRLGVNALLNPLGLELSTTVKKERERSRLNRLQAKGHWRAARYDRGLNFEVQKGLSFIGEVCLPYKDIYDKFPSVPDGDGRAFYLNNGWYEAVDAEVLYSMLRHFRPRRVVEVGSGFSTSIMRRAITDGGLQTEIVSIDPEPRRSVQSLADKHIEARVEELNARDILGKLTPGDLLFIDSSHTVTTGGDVPFLFLEVLPQLPPGVFVHVHDIFFPYDYPEKWVFDEYGWGEQYLVHAFLCFNDAFEIVWPASYMWHNRREDVHRAFNSATERAMPSSLWLKKLR